ncbi:AAA15 family ATPase/GTPase [Xanthomonas campestris]|uniref:AAA family ATPase n=1 Tax=Xanthomonas euroxanthea TaxID=2259622 RepID=UPI000CEE3E78|nr:ATP-binding protein [Xanthomonas euroxanthea]NIJ91862.1 AAA15 family ATPase/GTPase [Xanthomonas euroxanthea]PPT33378.1 hypothetical protein XaCFBP7622_01540 [Xanthomonas arboricola]
MRIRINQKHKSLQPTNHFTLPEFTVLTGQNGSGKTHLLEAISTVRAEVTDERGMRIDRIAYVPYNGLNPHLEEICHPVQLAQMTEQLWQTIQPITIQYGSTIWTQTSANNFESSINVNFGTDPNRNSVLRNILMRSGKSLGEITQEDVSEYLTFNESTSESLFTSQLAAIFKNYQVKWTKNKYNKFLAINEGISTAKYMEESDFIKAHGTAPWITLNKILFQAGLPYEFQDPTGSDINLPYHLRLHDKTSGEAISVNELSSGEKVLLSIALATYNSDTAGARPQLLLLDEPDAPLHPKYSSLLIQVLKETIVEVAGVNVIMTTHSPSTVAMSPDNSIFEITRSEKIPNMISSSRAVSVLTAGIGYLRVSYDKRKTIFVESKYDVLYYEKLFDALRRKHNFSYQPIFMEPHTGTSNCTDVIEIVGKLRAAGNEQTWGIIDYDGVNHEREFVAILGKEKRYAIENYLLDPLYIALALIRYGKKSFSDFKISNHHTYPEARRLSEDDCQTIIDSVLGDLGIALSELMQTRLENGHLLHYPKSFLLHDGHKYESLLKKSYPELNAISRGQGDATLKMGLAEVIAEFPQFLPIEIGELFADFEES